VTRPARWATSPLDADVHYATVSAVAVQLPRVPVVPLSVPVAGRLGRLAHGSDPPRPAPVGHLPQRRLPQCRVLKAADSLAVALPWSVSSRRRNNHAGSANRPSPAPTSPDTTRTRASTSSATTQSGQRSARTWHHPRGDGAPGGLIDPHPQVKAQIWGRSAPSTHPITLSIRSVFHFQRGAGSAWGGSSSSARP
jgi:hypothetical protein